MEYHKAFALFCDLMFILRVALIYISLEAVPLTKFNDNLESLYGNLCCLQIMPKLGTADVTSFTAFHILELWVIKMRVLFIPLQLTDARTSFMFLLEPNFYYFSWSFRNKGLNDGGLIRAIKLQNSLCWETT